MCAAPGRAPEGSNPVVQDITKNQGENPSFAQKGLRVLGKQVLDDGELKQKPRERVRPTIDVDGQTTRSGPRTPDHSSPQTKAPSQDLNTFLKEAREGILAASRDIKADMDRYKAGDLEYKEAHRQLNLLNDAYDALNEYDEKRDNAQAQEKFNTAYNKLQSFGFEEKYIKRGTSFTANPIQDSQPASTASPSRVPQGVAKNSTLEDLEKRYKDSVGIFLSRGEGVDRSAKVVKSKGGGAILGAIVGGLSGGARGAAQGGAQGAIYGSGQELNAARADILKLADQIQGQAKVALDGAKAGNAAKKGEAETSIAVFEDFANEANGAWDNKDQLKMLHQKYSSGSQKQNLRK